MARKRKTIKIDDREITVLELTVQDILDFIEDENVTGDDDLKKPPDELSPKPVGGSPKDLIDELLPKATDIKLAALKKMAPSEIKEIWDAFKEVNAVFFEAAQNVGLGGLLNKFKAALLEDFGGLLVGLLREDTPTPSDTDTPSS